MENASLPGRAGVPRASRIVASVASRAATATEVAGPRPDLADLQRSVGELRDLYEAAPCGYHSLDVHGLMVRINATELRWLGYAREELLGKVRFQDLLVPRCRGPFERKFTALKGGDTRYDSEFELRRKDGSTFPVLLSSVALRDENGAFVRTQGSLFDLTERKRAQTDLADSERRNTAILDAALDAIVSIDDRGCVVEFNAAAARTFGYAREDALGMPIAKLLTPEGALLERERRPERLRATATARGGAQFPVEFALAPVEVRGATLHTLYMRDITREEDAARDLRRYADDLRSVSHRLVEVQEAERRALAGALHDLVGQKLTALSINLNIVKGQAPMSTASLARLDDALRLVEETMEGIRDVMAELRPAVLDDYGLIPVLRWYAEQFTARTGVATTVRETGDGRRLPQAVEEAAYRIAQEALANVAKYARARAVEVTMEITPGGCELTIADDGCGFTPDAGRIVDGHRGFGLVMMRERAEAVGACVRVQSTPGRGTRVVMTLTGYADDPGRARR